MEIYIASYSCIYIYSHARKGFCDTYLVTTNENRKVIWPCMWDYSPRLFYQSNYIGCNSQGSSERSGWTAFGQTTIFLKAYNSILQKATNKEKYWGYFWTCSALYIMIQQIENPYDEVANRRSSTHTRIFNFNAIHGILLLSNKDVQSAKVICKFN